MILLLPPQLASQANQQISISADLHSIKNPVVTEFLYDDGWRKFEIVEGEVACTTPPPPSDAA